jgi:uncharacterized protein YkwD
LIEECVPVGDTEGMARRFAIFLSALAFLSLALVPAAGAITLDQLIASPSVCPGQDDLDASVPSQEQTMLCMTNFARRQVGDASLSNADSLDWSATDKSRDILRCNSFSHYACGRDFTFWMQRAGYMDARCWHAGENIAWGTGNYGTVHGIFKAWIYSPEHRDNILGDYRQLGVGLRVGTIQGYRDAHVWTQHFGSHC